MAATSVGVGRQAHIALPFGSTGVVTNAPPVRGQSSSVTRNTVSSVVPRIVLLWAEDTGGEGVRDRPVRRRFGAVQPAIAACCLPPCYRSGAIQGDPGLPSTSPVPSRHADL